MKVSYSNKSSKCKEIAFSKRMSWGRVRFGLYTSNLATATQLLISELFYHTVQEAYIHKAETIDTAKTIHRDRNIAGVQIT